MMSATSNAPQVAAAEDTTVWSHGKHIPELDGFRGLAILIVTVYRFAKYVPTDTVIGKFLFFIIGLGERGVDMFFVLSGFLITGVLLDSRDKPKYFANFYARRTLRIFPLYYASLAVFLFLIPSLWPKAKLFEPAQDQQFYLWTYLANVRIAMTGGWCLGALDHFWSLAVEEHFYLLWPVIVFALTMRTTLFFAIAFASLCAAMRIGFAAISDNGVAADVLSFFRFDGMLLGAVVACLARTPEGLKRYRKHAIWVALASAVGCIGLYAFTGRLLTISHSAWAFFCASFMIVLLTGKSTLPLARLFRNDVLRSLGKYSYAMYVFQSPLIPILAGVWSVAGIASQFGMNPNADVTPTLIYAAGMFFATYSIAIASWYLFEKRFLAFKRFF